MKGQFDNCTVQCSVSHAGPLGSPDGPWFAPSQLPARQSTFMWSIYVDCQGVPEGRFDKHCFSVTLGLLSSTTGIVCCGQMNSLHTTGMFEIKRGWNPKRRTRRPQYNMVVDHWCSGAVLSLVAWGIFKINGIMIFSPKFVRQWTQAYITLNTEDAVGTRHPSKFGNGHLQTWFKGGSSQPQSEVSQGTWDDLCGGEMQGSSKNVFQ